MRRCVWSTNLKNEEAMARVGPQHQRRGGGKYTYPACGKSFWVSPKCPRICPRQSPQEPSEFLEEDDRVRSRWFGWASCEEASDGLDTTWALPSCPVVSPWTRAQTARLRISEWEKKEFVDFWVMTLTRVITWRWKQYVSSKHWQQRTRLYGITQKSTHLNFYYLVYLKYHTRKRRQNAQVLDTCIYASSWLV